MTDFLKSMPNVTKDEYMWEWSVPQVRLSMYDYSHVLYLSEKEAKKAKSKRINTAEDLMNDLGVPISLFNDKK